MSEEFHLSPQELLMVVDGELSGRAKAEAEAHLAACWLCRSKKEEVENSISTFMRFHRENFEGVLPPRGPGQAHLRAQLQQLQDRDSWLQRFFPFLGQRLAAPVLLGAAVVVTCMLGVFPYASNHQKSLQATVVTIPNHALTPGATVRWNRRELCDHVKAKNKTVSTVLQREVFAEYGIPMLHPNAYEVDYLITPALGGADDIRNLWPESTQTAAGWNAQAKDALEDRLRDLVCDGQVDLTEAQQEIASNWIETYKKYFQTNHPPY